MATAIGYAAVSSRDGTINVRSISDRPEGAMINWLWTEGGVRTGNANNDEWVRDKFNYKASLVNVMIAKVSIEIEEYMIW